jgi:putative transposase
MPNHIHVIIFLQGRAPQWKMEAKPGTASRSLSSVIQAFKSRASRAAKEAGFENIFQRGFYEHVIRDEDDLHNQRRYILENPLKWELDKENPTNFGKKF